MVEFFLKFPLSDVNTWINYNFKPVTGENFIKFGKTEMSVMGCMLAKIRLVRFFWGIGVIKPWFQQIGNLLNFAIWLRIFDKGLSSFV